MDLKKFIRMQQKRHADKNIKSQRMRQPYSHQTGFCMRRRERKWGQGNIWGANGWKISRIDERQEFTNIGSTIYAKKDKYKEIHI